MLWNGLSTPDLAGLLSASINGVVAVGLGVAVDALEAATRSRLVWVADGSVECDAPERSGSENRHDAVRVSGSQLFHAQMVASE
jgi:hypothetical protein